MSDDDRVGRITSELEVAERSHKRATADIVVALVDRAWTQGWIIGFTTGVALVVIIVFSWEAWKGM